MPQFINFEPIQAWCGALVVNITSSTLNSGIFSNIHHTCSTHANASARSVELDPIKQYIVQQQYIYSFTHYIQVVIFRVLYRLVRSRGKKTRQHQHLKNQGTFIKDVRFQGWLCCLKKSQNMGLQELTNVGQGWLGLRNTQKKWDVLYELSLRPHEN